MASPSDLPTGGVVLQWMSGAGLRVSLHSSNILKLKSTFWEALTDSVSLNNLGWR